MVVVRTAGACCAGNYKAHFMEATQPDKPFCCVCCGSQHRGRENAAFIASMISHQGNFGHRGKVHVVDKSDFKSLWLLLITVLGQLITARMSSSQRNHL